MLTQIATFTGQLDENKADIVDAIETLNRLAERGQRSRSRHHRVGPGRPARAPWSRWTASAPTWSSCSKALGRLSDVGTRVIRASKDATINALTQLAARAQPARQAGDDFAKSFQVFLTYPFVDEVVGRDPAGGPNLHMGDYTNLSIKLDIDVGSPGARTRPAPHPARTCRRSIPTEVVNAAVTLHQERRPDQPSLPTVLLEDPAQLRSECRNGARTRTSATRADAAPGPCPGGGRRTARPGRPALTSPDAGRSGAPDAATARSETMTLDRADGGLRPDPRRPARCRGWRPMITRRTKMQLLVFVHHHPGRGHLRRRPLRPARPAVLRRRLHRGRALRRVRRHLRRRRGHLPRRRDRPGREAGAHRRGRRRLPRHRQQVRRDPAGRRGLVGNRSAVGEQYVELQPQTDEGPTSRTSRRSPWRTPGPRSRPRSCSTDISTNTVSSVDKDDLQTVVTESALAFDGTGEDLGQIIDTSNSFIETANANFDTTTALIRDSNTVLHDAARQGVGDPQLHQRPGPVQRHLAGTDPRPAQRDRQRLGHRQRAAHVPRGEPGQPRLADQQPGHHRRGRGQAPRRHRADPGALPLRRRGRLHRGRPRTPGQGRYDAHFGMILTPSTTVCHAGYEGTDRRPPQDGSNRPMKEDARCAEPASQSNARGAQNAPARRRRLPRTGGRLLRPGHQEVPVGPRTTPR